MKNITILWWFWCWNIWDDTILKNEIKILKEKYPKWNITVLARDVNIILNNFPWVKAFKLPPIMFYRFYRFLNLFFLFKFIKIIKNTDIFVLWWWWFFSDRQFFAIWWWLRWAKLAKIFWSKVIWFWMWAWPFFHEYNKKLIKKYSKIVDIFILRDSKSYNNLLECWVNKKRLLKIIDPAFFTKDRKFKKEKNIWFIINNKENKKYFIKQIKNFLKKTDFNIKLIITSELDIPLNNEILNILNNNRCELVSSDYIFDIIESIWKCSFIISQRLHWSIIAFTQKTPFLNISYHFKWEEIVKLLNIEDFSIKNEEIENINIYDYFLKKDKFIFKEINLKKYKELYFSNI